MIHILPRRLKAPRRSASCLASIALIASLSITSNAAPPGPPSPPPVTPYPILFVTQVPIPGDFTAIASAFGNHRGDVQSCGRGGDLWIRYPDGTAKNLTQLAGFGNAGFQGATSIAVRDPCVHWNGTRAVFSMVVGAVTQQYVWQTFYWQMYEVTGLGASDTPVITKVPYQPTNANNVSPIYASDGRILFTSDRPRDGQPHLYPQLDEYEEAPTVTGIWSLDPISGDLKILTHAPSGDFTPLIDSFGRLLFTQWDHLQRDQQADADGSGGGYGTFDWSDESATSTPLAFKTEVYPEPRPNSPDLPPGSNLEGHTFNQFFPWQARQDGSEQETLNHIGRHELHSYFDKSLKDDPNVHEFISVNSGTFNPNRIENMFQLAEDPQQPGTYFGTNAPEFYTHAAGQLVKLSAPPGANPDQAFVTFITHPDTASFTSNPSPDHSGHYRDPLPLSDGTLIAAHTAVTDLDQNLGSTTNPIAAYDFRLKVIASAGPYFVAGAPLTAGITKSVSWWSPDVKVTWSGTMWELTPVEVRPHAPPAEPPVVLPTAEKQSFAQAGVDEAQFRAWLWQQGLAVIVSRNVTTRDHNDEQQPYNLRVLGTATQTVGSPGKLYDIAHAQLFQADQVRGLGGAATPKDGRRVLARALHDPAVQNPPDAQGPAGSVSIGADGSLAAFVPARRALSWQLTDGSGTGVVRERYWLGFQPGEIRSCTSCHGVNTTDQAGHAPPTNVPQALTGLLQHWKTLPATTPSLGPVADGTAGQGAGGPFGVLTVNGSTGGASHRVDVAIGAPLTITVTPPPSHPSASHFALWVLAGAPAPSAEFTTFVGTLVFPPPYYAPPGIPGFFTLTNNLWQDPTALTSSSPAPWSLTLPSGLPFPATFTIQGVIEDDVAGASPFGVTNAVVLRVQ